MRQLLAALWLAAIIVGCSAEFGVTAVSRSRSIDQSSNVRLPLEANERTKEDLLEYHRRALLRRPRTRMTNAHSGIEKDSEVIRQTRQIMSSKVSSKPQIDRNDHQNDRNRSKGRRLRKRRPVSRRLRPRPTTVVANKFAPESSNNVSKRRSQSKLNSSTKSSEVVKKTEQDGSQSKQVVNVTRPSPRARQRVNQPKSIQRAARVQQKSNHRFARKIVEGTLQNVRGGARLISARGNYGYVPLVNKLIDNATLIRENLVEGFDCRGKTYGYYADQLNDCQIFHICVPMKQIFPDHFTDKDIYHFSFICPEYTIFSQDAMVCAWEGSAVPCGEAHNLYYMNRNFFVVSNDDVQKEVVTTGRPQTVGGGYQVAATTSPQVVSSPVRPVPASSGTYTGSSLITPASGGKPYQPLPGSILLQPNVQSGSQPYRGVPPANSQGRQSGSNVQISAEVEVTTPTEQPPTTTEMEDTTLETETAETVTETTTS